MRTDLEQSTKLSAIALCAAAALACAAPAAAQGSTVSGEVVDAATGRPVPGAVVQLDVATRALADSAGRFTLRRVAPGAYDAVVTRVGYERREERWTVARGEPLEVVVRLAPEPVELAEVRVRARSRYEQALDRNLNAAPVSTRLYRQAEFERTISPNAADFVRTHVHLIHVRCLPGRLYRDCVRWRTSTVPLYVFVDERRAPWGMQELESYPLTEIARVEVLDNRVVRVYTHAFMARAARTDRIPIQ